MNTTNTVLIVLGMAVAGLGPFIAVHRGGQAFYYECHDEPEETQSLDDTMHIPRTTDEPYNY